MHCKRPSTRIREFDTNNPQVFNGTNSLFNVGFQQPILVKGKFRLQKAAANQMVEQKQFSLVSDRFDMLAAVRQQFYTVLAAERRVQVLTELLGISAGSLKAAEGRVQAGEGTLPEVLLLRTECAAGTDQPEKRAKRCWKANASSWPP